MVNPTRIRSASDNESDSDSRSREASRRPLRSNKAAGLLLALTLSLPALYLGVSELKSHFSENNFEELERKAQHIRERAERGEIKLLYGKPDKGQGHYSVLEDITAQLTTEEKANFVPFTPDFANVLNGRVDADNPSEARPIDETDIVTVGYIENPQA